jgi:hypothetical protein
MFKQFFLFIFLFCSASTFAQVIVTGTVIDKKKQAIQSATVFAVKVNRTLTDNEFETTTDKNGEYSLSLASGKWIFTIIYGEDRTEKTITIPNQANFEVDPIKLEITEIGDVVIKTKGGDIEGVSPIPHVNLRTLPILNFERFLVLTQAGVNSNNELTANYNVRGGNYDENLVYVNGFLINRPFLTRAGQQEGLSFVNTSLVEDIYFSSGGFRTIYGDKLSSVLDIYYKNPDSLRASAMASLLGVEAHIEDKVGKHERLRYLFGARYRANGYLLNSLPTKGNYNPVFWDAQLVTTYDMTEKWKWQTIAHLASNTYQFAPETQKTDFGTANEAFAFNIYFDGQEKTNFITSTVGTSFNFDNLKEKRRFTSNTFLTYFRTNEKESFDIQGQYFINELETDPSKEEFGDSIAVLGVGTFLNHARNVLTANIYSIYNQSTRDFVTKNENNKHQLKFGAGFEIHQFQDQLSEWRMLDSAGYSVPNNNPNTIELFETIKGNLNLENQKSYAFVHERWLWKKAISNKIVSKVFTYKDSLNVQRELTKSDTIENTTSTFELDYGLRAIYTLYNNEFMLTPRTSITFTPAAYVYHEGKFIRRLVKFRFSSGLYYQPPFYREFRTFEGGINPAVRAQKSFHVVLGNDFTFYMWHRAKPFKLTTELYYKYLWDINPYEVDNVRTRYYAENMAKGYATGFDATLNGEFIPGLMSFFKVGILSTKEDIKDDFYYDYYNAAGEKIVFGISEDQEISDSVRVEPGFIRRPTDQLLNVGVLFQDHFPGLPQLSAQVGITYGSRLPYGPPDRSRYKDTLTIKSYFRVDFGMTYDVLMKKPIETRKSLFKKMESLSLSLEVFNLLGINNVLSKQWIQDVSGKYYSVPNYLTQRRFNLKLVVKF